MLANPKIVQEEKYNECMKGKYEELKAKFRPELERIMSRGRRNAIIGAVTGASLITGAIGAVAAALLGAGVTYPSWLDALEDFEREKLGPAREAAKAECRKQAGMTN